MTRLNQLCTASTLATLLTSCAAFADVTAQQVWNDWRTLMSGTGAQIGFEQSASDGILAINNLSLTTTSHSGNAPTQINLGSVVFQEQNDGTVLVLLPTDAPIVVTKGTDKFTLNQTHNDLSLVVSGAPKNMTYTYKAAALSLTLVEMIIAGQELADASAEMTLSALNGITQTRNADLKAATQDMSIGALSYTLKINDPHEGIQASSQGSATDLKSSFDVAIPENIDDITLQGALNAGLKAISKISYGTVAADFNLTENGEVTKVSASSENGTFDMKFRRAEGDKIHMSQTFGVGSSKLHTSIKGVDQSLLLDFAIDRLKTDFLANLPDNIDTFDNDQDSFHIAMDAGLKFSANAIYEGLNVDFSALKERQNYTGQMTSAAAGFGLFLDRNTLRYSGGFGTTTASLTTPELPVGPLEFSVVEMRTKAELPLNISTVPAPFSYSDRFINLSISDNLWALFDPEKLLPRGAATYVLDITGMGNWLVDPLNEEFQNRSSELPKGELHSLNLNDLQVSGAGIDLTGSGAFTFNNDDLETFGGMPAPTGKLDLKMVGLNQLMDTLIQIGLLQEDEAFGARMGLGLFTVADDAEDTLISEIEITQDGKVTANGKRLK